jgi:cyclic beta-1,2-glucan synthetase
VDATGQPRVLLLARALVSEVQLELDQDTLLTFVHDYQKQAPLTVAELWAFPTVLRLVVLENLARTLSALHKIEVDAALPMELPIEPTLGVERSIRALRLLAETDWKVFFENASLVEEILATDPSKVYELSDFETCDACRKVVEEIAWGLRLPEHDVAATAVSMAMEHPSDSMQGHVGHYLIGDGRIALEQRTGYRPKGARVRLQRALRAHPTASYLGLLNVLSMGMGALLWSWLHHVVGALGASILTLLATIQLTSVATVVAHRFFTRVLAPRTLPKLALAEGIPAEYRTAIVIPALCGRTGDVDDLLGQLEVHYLSNPDPSLAFALLLDHVDTKEVPDDAALLAYTESRLREMNLRHGRDGKGPFHVLYRESLWNPAESCFMGWERKRGKLWEWNLLLRGLATRSRCRRLGDPDGLVGIRYVITLDADTRLPLGAAQRLIGLLAHRQNRAVIDPTTRRVTAGYTVVQPRVETSPLGAPSTYFARVRAGDTAIDIYTNAVSDLYQDLFGAGIYVGKGIYDVDAFMQSLEGRAPENALASHDLFEGSHGRAGLATDVVLFEEYPDHYLAFTRRQHRWIRGDWQLLPWLFGRVPGETPGESLPNVMSAIDRFKIADNLRRSLFAPSLLVLVTAGLFILPRSLAFVAVVPLLAPLLLVLLSIRGGNTRESLGRYALYLLSLPHEAWTVLDAIARVAARSVTKKHRLEWVTAAHTARSLRGTPGPLLFYRDMAGSVMLCMALLVALTLWAPRALWVAAPFIALWMAAPEVLRRASSPPVVERRRALSAEDRGVLGRLARRTWYFFESFVGPGDQWLPPDNFQAFPRGVVAHRTSPTNIGLLLVVELSAHDFGYIGPKELSLLLSQSFGTLLRMERYAGHWLNWYGTKDLTPLLPRYVSTVDSGNLGASLIALSSGCNDVVKAPILGERRKVGLMDTLGVLEEALLPARSPSLDAAFGLLSRTIANVRGTSTRSALVELMEVRVPALSSEIVSSLGPDVDRERVTAMKEARVWLERLDKQARSMRQDHDAFLGWLEVAAQSRERGIDPLPTRALHPETLSLKDVALICESLLEAVGRRAASLDAPGRSWAEQARVTLRAAMDAALHVQAELLGLGLRARTEACAMDYRFLYNQRRSLFHTGYNVTSARLDPSFYDLLASEARLASFMAIMLQQVPVRHWFALGRPVTRRPTGVALLSWGATMFEYLLPNVLMRSQPGTLLAQSADIAVETQIAYGRACGTPWGISESSFAQLDAQDVYQYRSFGVPGLGLKRGLEDDLVISPYASVLAVGLRPHEVLSNLASFAGMGAIGTYGLYEAIDYRSPGTSGALDEPATGPGYTLVRSHMAHHQGMIFASLNNALHGDTLVERFHADPLVHTAELLLNERVPPEEVAEEGAVSAPERSEPETASIPSYPTWTPIVAGPCPELLVLTNGRLTACISDAGGGHLRWKGLAITASCVDPTRDVQGTWIYLRDLDSGEVWSATAAPTRAPQADDQVSFAAHRVETHERRSGISARMEVAVAQLHDAEIRHVTLHNESDVVRKLALSSYLEPVLEPAAAAARHPAFSRMFVECEIQEELHGVVCERRRKSPEDVVAALVHRVVWESDAVRFLAGGTNRRTFLGRLRTVRSPSMQHDATVRSPLDPAATLEVEVTLAPGATVELAWVTTVAVDRTAALEIAQRFGTMHAASWVVRDAERECARRLRGAGIQPALLPAAARVWSRLLAPAPFHGASALTRRNLTPAQPELWGHGLSGDHPIMVVHVKDPEQGSLVAEVVAFYRYMRAAGISMELVFLDGNPSGYQADQAGNLRAFLISEGAAPWLFQSAGIFVLAKDRLGAEETLRIEAAAQVLLFAERGSMAAQWLDLPLLPAPLPRLPRTRAPEEATVAAARSPSAPLDAPLLFPQPLGGFSADGREYVVVSSGAVPTPAPWSNVLANPEFGCLVSESSLGCTWSVNAGENRLTPWRNDATSDTPSEVLYVRDEETAQVWSSTTLPAALDVEVRVRHGAGYTVFEQESHALRQELTVFVPADAPVKILRLRMTNLAAHARRLTVTHYVEWLLLATRSDNRTHVLTEMDKDASCILARGPYGMQFRDRVAFMTCDRPIHGFTCDRAEFLGRGGDLALPDALTRWGLCGTTEPGTDPCGALQTHVELGALEEVTVYFVLGQGKNREDAVALARTFREPARAEEALRGMNARWEDLLSAVVVKTPEPAMDLMLNRWFLYQSLASRFFARAAFYQSSGAFGFRDQLQDVMAYVNAAPEMVRAHILLCAAHQFQEGDVLHWWHPPADAGVRTRCSDDYLWLIFVTAHYVESTGDVGILDEQVPFLEGAPLSHDEGDRYAQFPLAAEPGTLFEHCRRALRRGYTEGPHGLPLIGGGDWNDGLSRVGKDGKGESVWLAWFLHASTQAFIRLAERVRPDEDVATWKERADVLRKATEASAWDGAWYLRAFYDDGTPIGTKSARFCRIDSIAQSWAVLSGAADRSRAEIAVRSADEHLVLEREARVLLLTPPFQEGLHDPGYIQAYPAGVRENGGQYTHAATWHGFAHAKLGDGEGALKIFQLLNPVLHTRDQAAIQNYRVEPYVLAADVYDAKGAEGRGGWTWYTGAAAWAYRLGIEGILGITRVMGGVRIELCIPPSWPGFEATVRVGTKSLHVQVENPGHVGGGVASLLVNGVPVSGTTILSSDLGEGTHVEVRVVLGG